MPPRARRVIGRHPRAQAASALTSGLCPRVSVDQLGPAAGRAGIGRSWLGSRVAVFSLPPVLLLT